MNELFNSESSRHYISLLQENITRMAANCTSCKTWLITIVSALFALQLASDALKPYLWIALIPTFLFFLLDAYYLGQEKRFRDLEEDFVTKVKAGEDVTDILYTFKSQEVTKNCYLWKGMRSFSTWILYAAVVVAVIIICCVI